MERRIWKFIKGASTGEPSLAGFGGVVFQGEAKAGKSWRQGWAMGPKREYAGARFLVSQPERPGVERSPICVGPDTQCERSETEHRSRSKWAKERNGEAFRLSDKLESGRHECGGFAERRLREAGSGVGAKAAALRTRGYAFLSSKLFLRNRPAYGRTDLLLGKREDREWSASQAVKLRRVMRRYRVANTPPEKRKYLRKSQLWSEDFTAKLFCTVEFWIEHLPKLIGPQPEFKRRLREPPCGVA